MTAADAPRLFPLQPLLDAAGIGHGAICRRVGINGTRVAEVAVEGLTVAEADRWAIRLGLVPECVWTDFLTAGIEGEDTA